MRTVAPPIGPPDTESVTKPWTRPSGPEAPAKADARMNAATANAPTAIQLETRRWSVRGADMANTRPGKRPRHRCVGSESLKDSGEIIAREAQVGDPSSVESKDPRQAFDRSGRTIWTIGHSTRSLEEFIALLEEHRVQFLADVRHFPTSQRCRGRRKHSWPRRFRTAASRTSTSGISAAFGRRSPIA